MLRAFAQEYILCNRKRRDKRKLLRDDRDPILSCRLNVIALKFFSVDPDLPAVRLMDPHQNIHQRRLACAVFSHQRNDLAAVQRQIHALEDAHTGK